MKFHEIANIWPMMDEMAINALAEDIKQNGQIEPIWIYEGKILDGRNRYSACKVAKVEPKTRQYCGSNPAQFAFSCNEQRRHLTSGQRAALAAEIKPILEKQALKRMSDGPKGLIINTKGQVKIPYLCQSREQAAKITNTNGTYVDRAIAIRSQAPEVFEKLKAGKLSMQDAIREVRRIPTEEWKKDELERKAMVKAGKTVVANESRCKNLVAWAEKQGLAVSIDRRSDFGNPFILDSDGTRDDVIDKYRDYYLPHKPSIKSQMDALKGKVLICHCYPQRCHGDILAKKCNH
jgi:hypothetical protein